MIKTKIILVILSLMPFISLQAQEWEYTIKKDGHVTPDRIWVSEDDKIFLNLTTGRKDKNNKFTSEKELLAINRFGKYAGAMKISSCNNKARLIPLGQNQLMASGLNCSTGGQQKIRTEQFHSFDNNGNLKKARTLTGNFQNSFEPTNKGSISIKEVDEWKGEWIISEINQNLEIKEHPVNISSLLIPDHSLSPDFFNYMRPVWLNGTDIVVPFKRCKYNPKQPSSRHRIGSLLVKLNKNKIYWHYPEKDSNLELLEFQKVGDDFAIVLGNNFGLNTEFVLLNQNGEVKKKIPFQVEGFFQQMLVNNGEVIITSTGKRSPISHCLVSRFDEEMNLIETRKFYDEEPNMIMTKELIPIGKNSIIIAGFVKRLQGQPDYTFIRKLDFGSDEEEIMEQEEDLDELTIQSISFEEVNNNAMVVSAFPNPASIEINILLKEGYSPKGEYILQVFSIAGKPILQMNFTQNPLSINIADLPAGTYVYQVKRTDKPDIKVVTGKFLKV